MSLYLLLKFLVRIEASHITNDYNMVCKEIFALPSDVFKINFTSILAYLLLTEIHSNSIFESFENSLTISNL